jgi:sugar phosphate isomerase/epimerase
MKLSVWSSYYYHLSPEDALRELRAHGYKHCELSDEHALVILERGEARTVGAEFGKFARDIGMDLLQGHLFLNAKIGIPEDRELLMRQFELFDAIGVKNAVLHCDNFTRNDEDSPSLEFKREKNTEALEILCDAVKGTDMVICLENLRPPRFTTVAEDLLYFINRINSKNLGICLDTGHLNLSENPSQIEFIEKAGKHIKALHLADNDGLGVDQHLMPYGRGVVDFVAVIREMKKLGYDGLYNLEIPGERKVPLEISYHKLDYIKKMFDYLDKITE